MYGKGGNGGKTHPPEFKAKPAAEAPKERRTARETAAGRGLSPGPPFKRRKGFPGHPERASDMERRGEGGGGRRRGDGAPVRDPEVGMAASAGLRDAPRAARRRRAPHRHIRQQAASPVAGPASFAAVFGVSESEVCRLAKTKRETGTVDGSTGARRGRGGARARRGRFTGARAAMTEGPLAARTRASRTTSPRTARKGCATPSRQGARRSSTCRPTARA